MIKAAIFTKWKFVQSGAKQFQSYIDYIDREEAIRSGNFHKYNVLPTDGFNEYMENPEKSSGLFTQNKNQLTKDERKEVKRLFEKAQKNESIMWQDVVSFDTRWLIEQNFYDPKSEILNEAKIMNAIRSAMKEQLRLENLENSAVWTGAIHYNEKHHIHVHLAIVEPEPTRPYGTFTRRDGSTYEARKGFRSKKSVDRFKSQIMSQLLDRDQPLAQISSLVRNQIGRHKGQMRRLPDSQLQYLYSEIYSHLPSDMRLWKYNMNALDSVRPTIDRFSKTYIETYEQTNYQQLQSLLKENSQFYMNVYGEGTTEYQRANDFMTNKNQELFTLLGNSLLREMKEQKIQERQNHRMNVSTSNKELSTLPGSSIKGDADLNKIKKALKKDFQSMKNQQEYLKNMREREQLDQSLNR
ncbi:hypothetical protein JZO77_03445 [Enterococcus hulanensis]|uniref:MobP2 family relaxase n=1 Tax=Enterococcus hulanensis TaxID=2559929 RepID=UPI001A90B57A|nr:MobP2 family relaxase [Enterococcus hulanensis]MBO0455793.1 hypothetical protein [Enterococcus hulanensis]